MRVSQGRMIYHLGYRSFALIEGRSHCAAGAQGAGLLKGDVNEMDLVQR